jgi:hypothetical protein
MVYQPFALGLDMLITESVREDISHRTGVIVAPTLVCQDGLEKPAYDNLLF